MDAHSREESRETARVERRGARRWVGQAVLRREDGALLAGAARFIDDLPAPVGTLHAALLRSPHPHAVIRAIGTARARALPGVAAVFTGSDLAALTDSLPATLRLPIEARAMAVGRVRYVGEPVAVVLATDRYRAEDALDLIEVDYAPGPAVIDPEAALDPAAPRVHEGMEGNLASERLFAYGDPEAALAAAAHRLTLRVRYPRITGSPIETLGLIAAYDPHEGAYEVTANFQGPFSLHGVIARALRVPSHRLRLRTPPHSGGSFGVKQALMAPIVILAAAARLAGRPVKWIEDRLEHLTAATAATNRIITLTAGFDGEGRVSVLDWDQIEDCGAYLRAPEPATLYRMHGNMTGAYDIPHLRIRNRVVLTHKTPTGLVRGFGGPQVYYALERMMARIAQHLGLDPLTVITRNLIPAGRFPYRTASGALYDSGDYAQAIARAVEEGGLAGLLARREAARAAGRLYGVGFAAVVEPSVSNMGYVTTVLTPAERARAGAKGGALATATVSLDPLGQVSVHAASTPQGQGHRTVLAQVVADVFGLEPEAIAVHTELDTAKDAYSIASGNYSSRFAPAVAGAARLAAERLRTRLARLAARELNLRPEEVIFAEGRVGHPTNPKARLPFARLAAAAHWAPHTLPEGMEPPLRETVFWSPPELAPPDEADRVNSSLCHGFIFDFCGLEVERETGRIRIERYVTMHDAGTILHPALYEGQIRGGFAQGLGAALLEELAYAPDGTFLSGSFADYLLPTIGEIPPLTLLHTETPSPFTPLGAKGVGEGNCMSTPVCIANALADALAPLTGPLDLDPPFSPAKVLALLGALSEAAEAPAAARAPISPGGREEEGERTVAGPEGLVLSGEGKRFLPAPPERVWTLLLDPEALFGLIPGAEAIERLTDGRYRARLRLGVGAVRGRFSTEIALLDPLPPERVRLSGRLAGPLGAAGGEGVIHLAPAGEGCRLAYRYRIGVSGRVAAVGVRLLGAATRTLADQFLEALADRLAPPEGGGGEWPHPRRGPWPKLQHLLAFLRRLFAKGRRRG